MSDPHEYRVCPRCDRELPLTEEFWYPSIIKDIIKYPSAPFPRWCKTCSYDYEQRPEYKIPHAAYARKRNQIPEIRAYRIEYMREYNNRADIKEYYAEYRLKNRKTKLEYMKAYNSRPEVKLRVSKIFLKFCSQLLISIITMPNSSLFLKTF